MGQGTRMIAHAWKAACRRLKLKLETFTAILQTRQSGFNRMRARNNTILRIIVKSPIWNSNCNCCWGRGMLVWGPNEMEVNYNVTSTSLVFTSFFFIIKGESHNELDVPIRRMWRCDVKWIQYKLQKHLSFICFGKDFKLSSECARVLKVNII